MTIATHEEVYGEQVIPGVKIVHEGLLITNPDSVSSNDCPYCRGGDAQHNRELIDEGGALAYLDGRRLRVETFDIDGDPTDVSVKITYCPKCGQKLEDTP